MNILPKYRPSIEKRNAPYRGVTAEEDAVNFTLGTLHDLTHLQHVSGGKPGRRGHAQQIADNFSLLYHGEGERATASIPSAGTIVHNKGPVTNLQNLAGDAWTPQNGATVTIVPNGFQVASNGLLDEQGLSTTLHMEAGDIVSIRFKLTASATAATFFRMGARSFNDGRDDLKEWYLNNFWDGQYVEKRLRCRGRQDVEIAIYTSWDASGSPSSCTLEDFSLNWLEEIQTSLVGTDKTIKQKLAEDRERLALCRTLIHEGRND